jgi:type I restriction enzyme, S subunit
MMKTAKLGTICKMQSGGTPRRGTAVYYKEGTIPWAKIGDIENAQNGWIYDTEEKITELGLKSINNRLFPKGTLLFAMYGSVGKTSLAGTEMSSNQAILGIHPNKDILDVKYLNYWIKSRIKDFENQSRGVALKNLSATIMKDQSIPLPPLETQKKIAAILDKADELRQNDKKILEKYDPLAQSVFLEIFGDPVRNEKGWEIKTIEELVQKSKWAIKRGPFGGALKKEIFVDDGYLVYEQYHALNNDFTFERYYIDEQKFHELRAFEVKPNDIIISCSGVYLGKLAIIPENAKKGIINQALLKITLNENIMKNEFFVYHFSYKNFKEKFFKSNRGAGIPNLPPMTDFKKFPFITPPIKDQERFYNLMQNIDKQRTISMHSLQKSEELFQSLLHRAFSGELV